METMTESVHRSVNERTERLAPDHAESLECECECNRPECGSGFAVTSRAYATVRENGRRFIVTPGHQSLDEDLVSTGATYVVIEKHGRQGRLADSLNPR
jgi:hypothetical protein